MIPFSLSDKKKTTPINAFFRSRYLLYNFMEHSHRFKRKCTLGEMFCEMSCKSTEIFFPKPEFEAKHRKKKISPQRGFLLLILPP
jgi:hypothetical protein